MARFFILAAMIAAGVAVAAVGDAVAQEETSSEAAADAADSAPAESDEQAAGTTPAPLLSFEPGELAVLKRLAHRRKMLDDREAALLERERLVAALELALNEEAAELKRLRGELAEQEARLANAEEERSNEEIERIKNLAKSYQAMKPRDAARLFNEMDLELLTDIARQIAPRSLAPMMARMDPERARALTEALRQS